MVTVVRFFEFNAFLSILLMKLNDSLCSLSQTQVASSTQFYMPLILTHHSKSNLRGPAIRAGDSLLQNLPYLDLHEFLN